MIGFKLVLLIWTLSSWCIYSLSFSRIQASEAAQMIRRAYEEQTVMTLITSDASRGSKQLSGLACVIRQIGAVHDTIVLATRRIRSLDSKNIAKSEVGAMDLGISVILEIHNSKEQGQQQQLKGDILFITDSNSVIEHFCGNADKTKDLELFNMLLESTLTTNIFLTKVKSNKSEMDGFFDHDVADILCSLTRRIPNKEMSNYFIQYGSGNHNCSPFYTVQAPKLHDHDLEWLNSSEDVMDDAKTYPIRKQVHLKRERGSRIIRCKIRAKNDLGLEIPY